ncbi:MAG: D-alanine--D-alanine ligase [Desulfobulbaceae bacterium]|jgi:D-alanine-D-alanine ligase|nr:D-alanine--D-alanine ligase [Desulfobulbaceae bacterium]
MDKMRLALIAGGTSGEREVSLKGATAIEAALNPEKFTVRRFDPAHDLAALVAAKDELDFAFINLHGVGGEDGSMQGMLELLAIPYQGSGVLGSAIAMDKHLTKELYGENDLPTPDWLYSMPPHTLDIREIIDEFGFPVVVKPTHEGSSLGMTVARDRRQLLAGIERAQAGGRHFMIEEFIAGRELTVGVIGGSGYDQEEVYALPALEIIPGAKYSFFDYEAKYQPGATNEICPAHIPNAIRDLAQRYAISAHVSLRLHGYSRTDMRLDHKGNLYLLETNTIPGMTETSLLPQMAAAQGMTFAELLETLIDLGLKKKRAC